jgi:putative ABC transport system substrate-binding protein
VQLSPLDVRDAGNRARRRGIRKRVEWRLDRDGQLGGKRSSQPDRTLAARHKLPAIYFSGRFVVDGGLSLTGPISSTSTEAAGIDRILKGEKPADLPVQASTKYELVINLQRPRQWTLFPRRCSPAPTR